MLLSPFPVGTQLHVETCFGDHFTGDVVTYEHSVKMLILNCYSKDKNGKVCCKMSIVNMQYCKNMEIVKEVKKPDESSKQPARLNFKGLDKRYLQCVVQREAFMRSRNKAAGPRGQQLFNLLTKHFGSQGISWQLAKIVVLQQITISPPYRICDISMKQHVPKLLRFVQRVLERFNAQNKEVDAKANKNIM